MSRDAVRFETSGEVGWLLLNRPASLNAQNAVMAGEICDVLEALREEPAVRVLIVAGEGERAFSVGGDLADPDGVPSGSHVEMLAGLPIPTIAALHGLVYGGGLELALACDIRLAAEKTAFAFPEVGLGLLPGWGGTQRLPRLVGPGAAKEIILTGEPIGAERALAIGLVNRVVPADKLRVEAEALAYQILRSGPLAAQFAKDAINAGLDVSLAQGLEIEGDLYVLLESTQDRLEGIQAFREKRAPVWRAR